MQLGLEGIGKEDPDLIAAMAGLCDGVHRGKLCGTLSAASCLLYLINREKAEWTMNDELFDWFEESFGSTECYDLIDGNPINKPVACKLTAICSNLISCIN